MEHLAPLSTNPFRAGNLSVGVVMTGGTIAKTYDQLTAKLVNTKPMVKELISGLRTDDLTFDFHDLMHLDSLEIGPNERENIVSKVVELANTYDAVLVTHGTDSIAATANELSSRFTANVPIIFTGAFIPFTVSGSDALQNVTEALLAVRLLPAGIYLSMHNRILTIPGAEKDYANLTFVSTV